MMKSRILRIFGLILCIVLFFSAFSCKKLIVQNGDVDQNKTADDFDLKGRILFTIDNSSFTEEMMSSVRAISDAFMRDYPNVVVTVEGASRSTFPTRISSGDIGDVFWCDENDTNNYHYNHNALMPLDSYLKPMNINMGDVYTGALDCGRYDGRLYMVPRDIGLMTLMFNADMLKEAGITFDCTVATPWEDFKDICRRVTVIGDDGKAEKMGLAIRIWWDVIWQMFFRAYGGEWVDSIRHRITITDSTEVMRGIQEIYDGVMEGWLYPQDQNITGDAGVRMSKIAPNEANFTQVAFQAVVSFSLMDSYGKTYDNYNVDWDFCPFPAFENHTVSAGATGYVVFNRTSNPDAAAALALYFLTENGQRAYHSQLGGSVPLLRSLAEDDFWKGKNEIWRDKNFSAFVSYTENTRPATAVVQCPYDVATILSNNNMMSLWNNVLSGKADLQTAFGKLQQQANEKWDQLGG
ncbi:MAG: extracellular solute-binding protein [Clostridia bacterium]|nr:extracellular solute-binding protein [Clostridia bacterium]